jgi:hypothetical protein
MQAPIKLIEIEPNTNRFITQLSNDKSVASFIFKDEKMYVWGGRGDWVEFTKPYEIVGKIVMQQF